MLNRLLILMVILNHAMKLQLNMIQFQIIAVLLNTLSLYLQGLIIGNQTQYLTTKEMSSLKMFYIICKLMANQLNVFMIIFSQE